MQCQALESRTLFAVTAADIHDKLYVWGDAGNNGISVEKQSSDLVVKHYVDGSYQELFRTPGSGVNEIRIYGYNGADTISINDNVTHAATVYAGKGADWVKGGGGTNYLYGHGVWAGDPDHSHTTDDSSADTLISGKGNSFLFGQKGNDSLFTDTNAVSGTDVMYGGTGDDKLYLRGHDQNAYAFGEDGNDRFIVADNSTQFSTLFGYSGNDTIDYADWSGPVECNLYSMFNSGHRYGMKNHRIMDDIEMVQGSSYDDKLAGNNQLNQIYGRGGNDQIFGAGGNDVLYGGDGDDYIYANAGNDLVVGGDGNDHIWGGDNNDNLNGNDGHDWIEGDAGNDTITGGAGDDTLQGEEGNDTLRGGDGSDDIHGGAGNDALYGDRDADWLYGESGNDLLVGGHGSDFLVSRDWVNGNDALFGGNQDGTQNTGFIDVASIDIGNPFPDIFSNVEVVA